jgi:uncharacterized membrane protein
MTYLNLIYLHLLTVLPAFLLGTYLLLNQKGTNIHRFLGKFYLALMLITAIIVMFMPAKVGPSFLGHFGFIHLLALVVIYCVPSAYFAARQGNIKKHQANMLGVYVGGLLVAGAFALLPGRLLHTWIFS